MVSAYNNTHRNKQMSSTTHTIKIAFSVDEGVDAGRLMDDLIQYITDIRGTRDLKASHKREVH